MNIIEQKVYCRSCNTKTKHSVVMNNNIPLQYTNSSKDFIEMEDDFEETFYIIQCNGCDSVSFLLEIIEEDRIERDWVKKYFVYPEEPKIKHTKHKRKFFFTVPRFIKAIYREVVFNFNEEQFILCGMGLRMIIEGVCKDKGIDKKPLYNKDNSPKIDNDTGEQKYRFLGLEEKINVLQEEGHITKPHAIVLHQIREMGNDTAHEIVSHDEFTLEDAIIILENLLFNIYDLPKIEIYEKRR